jgi:hypothetical protein
MCNLYLMRFNFVSCSADGWSAMLQAGRSRVRVAMRLFNFFILPNLSNRNMALGFTQPLREMSSRKSFLCWNPARKFARNNPIRDMHICFQIPYVYDYITKLCRQQAKVSQRQENTHVRNIGQGEARHRKYKRLKLGGDQAYDRSSD